MAFVAYRLISIPMQRHLILENIDEETMSWLRRQSAAHGCSVSEELLDILWVVRADEVADYYRDNPFAATLRKARAMAVRTVATSQVIVRTDRDAR